ncbi:MAG: restriction endonuclease, partial [Flavobacterium sp.]
KYTRAIQNKLAEWIANPPEEFVKLVSTELLGSKRFTPIVKDQFTLITKRAFEQLIGERINERLKGAMTSELPPIIEQPPAAVSAVTPTETQVITSAEEIEGFHSVKAILRGLTNSKRIVMRDAQSYCAILLDDNNRKPICRLRFNNQQNLRLGIFNEKKEEVMEALESVDDIFNFADQLKATVSSYELSSKE